MLIPRMQGKELSASFRCRAAEMPLMLMETVQFILGVGFTLLDGLLQSCVRW